MSSVMKLSEFLRKQDISEDLLSKAYALSQNLRHNSVSQHIGSACSKIEANLTQAKRESDVVDKIDSLLDALLALAQVLRLQNEQSTLVKNVAVASVVLADDLNKTLEKQLSSVFASRR